MVEPKIQNFKKNKNIYKNIERQLKQILTPTTPINHVGSTAIPDMCGKNIIDILVGAKNNSELSAFKTKIEALGYFASENSRSEIYQIFHIKTGRNR